MKYSSIQPYHDSNIPLVFFTVIFKSWKQDSEFFKFG